MHLKPIAVILTVFLLVTSFSTFEASAQNNSGADLSQFAKFDNSSKARIDHQALSDVLEESVFPMSKATKRLGWKNKQRQATGSKLSLTVNSSPSRYEGNRLMIHAFSDGHTEFFLAYQQGLEDLAAQRPLLSFNKDQQLAYWLNLYNVIVMNKIIDEYPITNTKKLRKAGNSFWQEKATQIEGVSLSLEDIESILVTNWDSPLVIYGLWQGSVGGPSLPREAFTGDNVWRLLERNAREFINSNRGVIPKGEKLNVSLFFEWLGGAFENNESNLFRHIREYADPNFLGGITGSEELSYKYYDWQVSDLVGGNLSSGAKFASSMRSEMFFSNTGEANTAFDAFPEQAQALFIEMMKDEVPIARGPTPLVTSEECAPGETCEPTPDTQ